MSLRTTAALHAEGIFFHLTNFVKSAKYGFVSVDFDIENEALKTTANAAANLSFFLLPMAAIGLYSKRKKK